jgi:hypothetical protein
MIPRSPVISVGVAAGVTLALVLLALHPGMGATRPAGTAKTVQPSGPANSWWNDPNYLDFSEKPLAVTFLKPGASIKLGYRRGIKPSVTSLVLFAPGKVRVIESLKDLQGYVNINSSAGALQYVRLFTDLAAPVNLPQAQWREVTHEAGDRSEQRPFSSMLTKKQWRTNGLTEPVVKKTANGFTVTLWLWTPTQSYSSGTEHVTNTVYLVQHTLTRDGKMTEKILHKKKLVGAVIKLQMLK